MKKTAILILVFLFLILNCKKQKESKAEELVEEEKLVQLEGYRDTKWKMSKEEVEEVLIQRGLKRKSGVLGKFEGFDIEDKEIDYYDTFLGEQARVIYYFKWPKEENKLSTVQILFLNSYSEEKRELFLELKDMINDKYKNIMDENHNSVTWETSDTLICLIIEKTMVYPYEVEQMSIYYMPKEEIMERSKKDVEERLKSIIKTKKKL